jgi:iron-sulfur cluster assembly protein
MDSNTTPRPSVSANVIHLTPEAVTKIKAMKLKDEKPDHYLRVAVVTGGCAGMSYDMRFQKRPYDNDVVFEQDGIQILVNPESVAFLHGVTIDYKDTLKESGFQYINPNASSSCGCGVSFS